MNPGVRIDPVHRRNNTAKRHRLVGVELGGERVVCVKPAKRQQEGHRKPLHLETFRAASSAVFSAARAPLNVFAIPRLPSWQANSKMGPSILASVI